MKPIAICQNKKIFDHSTLWTHRFIDYCKESEIPFEVLDCYQSSIVGELTKYSALIWQYDNDVISDIMEARNVLQVAANLGLATFPYPEMNWHFDDKIAETYALQSVNAPIPKSWIFYLQDDCETWIKTEATFPLIAKLRCGSGSNNVKIIKNENEAIRYTRRMFTRGFDPAPSLQYKAISKFKSSKDLNMMVKRIKKIPEFLNTRRHAKMMPIEKGYCYFQEYIPNNGYDLKVVVIGDKLTFCSRNVRKHDFRASGGGDINYERSLLTDDVIETAFTTAERLDMFCVGFDFVVDNTTGQGIIIEMCYCFDWEVQKDLGAFVDRNHVWHENPVYVPDEIIRMICKKIAL